MKRLFDTDPLTGAVEWFHYDESNDTWCIERQCDVSDVIEANKKHLTSGAKSFGDEVFNRVAEIPTDVLYTWLTKYGVRAWDPNHTKKVRALLDSNEWRYLRTNEVYLGNH